ncbi:MAG: hypothetical protein QXP68_04145 [Thermosphaera sp.]
MSRSSKRETKLVSVYSDLIVKLKEISMREGLPLTEYVNRALEQAVRAHELGSSLREVVDLYERMRIQREAGLILIPMEVFNRMVEELRGEEVEGLWRDCGSWYGEYLSMRVRDGDPLRVLVGMLEDCGWKVKLTNLEGGGSFKCFSPTISLEATKLFARFIEGALKSLGYEILSTSCLRGLIELRIKLRKK